MAKKINHGTHAERKLASRLGARLTPGSGALEGQKSDMSLTVLRIESKSTVNQSIKIEHSWLKKIYKEALVMGQTPALVIQFVDSRGNVLPKGSWVCVPESVIKELEFGLNEIR